LPESGEWEIDKVAVNPYGEIQVTETDTGKNESKWIDVDIGAQRVYAMVGDRREREFLASTGIERYPTVTGQFQVWVKLRKDDMRGVDLGVPWHLPDVPYVMYFFSDYGIHGTYWHDNFGTPMSHGCVNLTIEDAEWLYDFSQVGTVVNVHH
jgi:lipoprotein-anchoring transpeptidase ErfK/SrfK